MGHVPCNKWMEIRGDFDLTSMKLHEVQATIIWGLFWEGYVLQTFGSFDDLICLHIHQIILGTSMSL